VADLDLSLVSAVLAGGKQSIRLLAEKGFRADLLEGDGKVVYDFATAFYKTYDDVPSASLVERETGVLVPAPTTDPLPYLINAAYDRKLHTTLHGGVKHLINLLDLGEPAKGQAAVEDLLREMRKLDTRTALVESIPGLGGKVIEYYEKIKRGERGIQTPWPTINDSTLGLWPEDLVLFVARMGIGKCVKADTLCTDPVTGIPHTIEQVFQNDRVASIPSWSKEQGIHSAPISAKVDTGVKQCFRVTFASGRIIEATPEHPLLTVEGWKKLEEFKVGMTAALPAKMNHPSAPVDLPSETVFLLALLLAEGSYTGNHVGFSSTDRDIIQRATEAAAAFDTEVKFRGNVDYDFVTTLQGTNKVRRLLQALGIDDTLAKAKTIPDEIYRLPAQSLADFLSVFWMCDGYVDDGGPGITLASERMVRQIQSLLLRFGIQSSVDYKQSTSEGKVFDAWRLRVYASSWEAFAGAIALWGLKAERLEQLLQKERNPNVGFPRVSASFVDRLREVAATKSGRWKGGGLKEVGTKLGRASPFMFRNLFGQNGNNTLILRPFQAFCEVFGVEDEFSWIWDSDIWWDTVEKIEDIGPQKIYDLTIDSTSCFVANDIIVHNTWSAILLAGTAWDQGKKVLIATTEMSKETMAMRYLATKFRIPYGDFRRGKLDSFTEKRIRDGIKAIENSPNLNIVGGDFDFSMDSFAGIVMDEKPDLVIVDGAYLLKVHGLTRTERAANVFDELKRIAKRSKAAVVATMQFNREVKVNQAKTVQADSIAMTDVAGWNADLIFGLIQTEEMKKNRRMAFKPLKVREGESEEIECNWDFERMDFSEIPKANFGGSPAFAPSGVPSGPDAAADDPIGDLF
jgi:replicative DNA helicase